MQDFDRTQVRTVVTLGEVMALFLAEVGLPLGRATDFELGFAGAEATVAVGLARLGHTSAFIGRIGDDALGRQILRDLRGEGVDVSNLSLTAAAPTGILVRDAPTDRPLSVQYYRAASAASTLRPEDIPTELISSASLLHITGITSALSESAHAAVVRAVEIARASGTTVCFDPNVRAKLATPDRWREVIEILAPLFDIVLTGADDARAVTDGDPAAWFLERGATTVVVKDGSKGAWETDGVDIYRQAVRPTVPADPVGAGDAFAAGWIGGWLRGLPPQKRLEEAATVASLCVSVRGDVPGLPDMDTLQRVLGHTDDVDR